MNKVKAVSVGLVFGLFLAVGCESNNPNAMDVEHASDEQVQALFDAGYWSMQGDDCECMYAPEDEPEWSKGV